MSNWQKELDDLVERARLESSEFPESEFPLLKDKKFHDDGYYANKPEPFFAPIDGERNSDIGGYGE